MGNNRGAVGKRKKKGRPSLLDLQKRSLRIQKQGQQQNPNPNPNPSPNPYLKFPNSTPTRRSTRLSTNLQAGSDDDEDEDDAVSDGRKKRRERKLKLVHNIPNGSSDLASSGSDVDANGEGSRKKRKIDSLETGKQNSSSKVTDQTRIHGTEEPSDSGPTTPLPDKTLLAVILEMLQKKDTYGVFLEPVDSNELPDYHDIIKHPMDFTTVRDKLTRGVYTCLEQFESDVFLISSNAMRYNAQDTIYYRQARSIQELAKKSFENLRQESDDNEPEPQPARRGRPPMKNTIKKMLAKVPADHNGCGFPSKPNLANSRDDTHSNSRSDLMRKGSSFDKMSIMDSSTRVSHSLRYNETPRNNRDPGSEYLGSSLKGGPVRNWKKQLVIDENRRDTYKQPINSMLGQEQSILTVFDLERKQLMPVGIRAAEHSYARSLARFAANLGPVGWEIASKRIQRVLPPGTKFGRGWIGENEAPPHPHPSLLTLSPHMSTPMKLLHSSTPSGGGNKLTEGHELSSINTALPPSTSASAAPTPSRSTDSMDGVDAHKIVKLEGKLNLVESGTPKPPLQPCMNGFNPGFGPNLPSQTGKSASHTKPSEELTPYARVLNAVCRNGDNIFANYHAPLRQADAEEETRSAAENPSTVHSGSMNPQPGSLKQDLNADFQSPGSAVSDVMADQQQKQQQQQQPDLALQL